MDVDEHLLLRPSFFTRKLPNALAELVERGVDVLDTVLQQNTSDHLCDDAPVTKRALTFLTPSMTNGRAASYDLRCSLAHAERGCREPSKRQRLSDDGGCALVEAGRPGLPHRPCIDRLTRAGRQQRGDRAIGCKQHSIEGIDIK
jgi:hypothetical protein